MKKTLKIPLLCSAILCSCGGENYVITDKFTFKDESFEIEDVLKNVDHEKAHVIFLYGQSNAVGITLSSYLEMNDQDKYVEYREGYENVYINYICDGGVHTSGRAFTRCRLGCGYSNYQFGPEMGIAEEMSKAYPNEKTFIVKWAWGGSILNSQWLNGVHQRGEMYNSAMDFSLKCLDYLTSKGYELTIDGICWMQGESDAFRSSYKPYYYDTVALVSALRLDLSNYQKEIKFIDAAINEDKGIWPKPVQVNKAKIKFSKESNLNYYIDTNELGIITRNEPYVSPDIAHYDSMSMVSLGQEFGKIAAQSVNK